MIIDYFKNNDNVLFMYYRGSVTYEMKNTYSDIDVIVIVKDIFELDKQFDQYKNFEYRIGNRFNYSIKYDEYDLVIYTLSEWLDLFAENQLLFLETKFLKSKFKIKESYHLPNTIIKNKLISCKRYYDFNKWELYLTTKSDYLGRKELWNSIRELMYIIQIYAVNRIYNYKCANMYYDDIMYNPNLDHNKYKVIFKDLEDKLSGMILEKR